MGKQSCHDRSEGTDDTLKAVCTSILPSERYCPLLTAVSQKTLPER
jgi:hypothetical protein